MEKIFSFLAALIVLLYSPHGIDNNGVYVPSYSSFMESFTGKVEYINNDLYEAILDDCNSDGIWVEPSYNSHVRCYDVSTALRIYEGNGFLDSVSISLSKDKLDKEETLFKELVIAAASSIIQDTGEEFERSLFDNIHYDYAMESPAGYISMYWNCGVYLFNFTKSSSEIELEISLSVYEVE